MFLFFNVCFFNIWCHPERMSYLYLMPQFFRLLPGTLLQHLSLEASGTHPSGCHRPVIHGERVLKHLGHSKKQQAQELGFSVKVSKLVILSSAQGVGI